MTTKAFVIVNIKADKRICNFCQAKEVEDEMHFLIKCQKFSFEREELLKSIEKSCKNFKELSDENKFLWLMTTEDIFILVKLANHIFTCFKSESIHVLVVNRSSHFR